MKKMTYTMTPYETLPCELEVFTINGRKAKASDFGRSLDRRNGGVYSTPTCTCRCKNRYFEAFDYDETVAREYHITAQEYYQIVLALEKTLCVGRCKWCSMSNNCKKVS